MPDSPSCDLYVNRRGEVVDALRKVAALLERAELDIKPGDAATFGAFARDAREVVRMVTVVLPHKFDLALLLRTAEWADQEVRDAQG